MLLRLLGIYYVAWAAIDGGSRAGSIWHIARELGWDDYLAWRHTIQPAVELVLGIYFLIGGRWVFNRLLAPIPRRRFEHASAEVEPKSADDPR